MSFLGRNSGNDVAKAHQQSILGSLQHRLDAARAKGDEALIRQLEQEKQQAVSGSRSVRSNAPSQRLPLQETTNVHRQNLLANVQHRLEVAKANGDQNLINQLEREMQQLA